MPQHLLTFVWFDFESKLIDDDRSILFLPQFADRCLQGRSNIGGMVGGRKKSLRAFLTTRRRRDEQNHRIVFARVPPISLRLRDIGLHTTCRNPVPDREISRGAFGTASASCAQNLCRSPWQPVGQRARLSHQERELYSFSFRYSVVFPIPSTRAAFNLSPFS